MNHVKIKFDDKQIDRIANKNDTIILPFWKSDRFFQLVQILAIVFSGIWILVQFFDYGREAAKVSMKRDELAAELSRLSLQTQQEQREARQAELENSIILKQLDIQLKELEREDKQLNLVASKTRKIDYEYWLEVKKTKELLEKNVSQFVANLTLNIKNTSKTNLSIDFIVIDAFVKEIQFEKNKGSIAIVEPVGVAPDLFCTNIEPKPGFIVKEWHWVMRQSYVSPSISDSARELLKRRSVDISDVTPGGSGVGTFKNDESIEIGKEYVVLGKEGNYISFVINVCFNGCSMGSDRWWFPYTELLPSDQEKPE